MESFQLFIKKVLLTFSMTSCGLLGLYNDEIRYLNDDEKREFFEKVNHTSIALLNDSIQKRLSEAKDFLPKNLNEHTLFVENYNQKQFTELLSVRFHQNSNSEFQEKFHDKRIKQLIRKYKYSIKYTDSNDIRNLDESKHLYILKTKSLLLPYNEEELNVREDRSVAGWAAKLVYYIYDQSEDKFYKPLPKIKYLYKNEDP